MNKKFTKLIAALALLVFMAPSLACWGDETGTLTFSSTASPVNDSQSKSWTIASVGAGSLTYQSSGSCLKLGTNSQAATSITVTTSGYSSDNISKIQVWGTSKANTNVTAKVYIGSNLIGESSVYTSQTSESGGTEFSVNNTSNYSGEIQVVISRPSSATGAIYLNKVIVTYTTSGGGSQAAATTTTIDASGITNNDINISTAAGSLSATVSANNTPIEGATVTWSGNNDAVATIDSDGVVTLVGAGTVTFTAAYAGVSGTYQPSSDTYEMTVTYQPTTIEITPNYTFWGKNAQFSGTTNSYLEGTKDNVSLEWESGNQGYTYANQNAMRFYPKNTLTFTAPTGYEIKSITLTISGTYSDLTFDPTGFSGTTWTGASNSVEMSRPSNGTSYATISKFTIIIGLPKNVATPTFSLASGSYVGTQNVTISCETSDATIYYTTDGTTPSANNGTQGTSVSIEETTTLKAIAIKGNDDSDVASVDYTILTPLTSMQEIFNAATSTEKQVAVTFDNWVISGVTTTQAYLTDGTKGCMIFGSGHGFVAGNVLSGTVICKLVTYYGKAEFKELTTSTSGISVTTGGIITPRETTIGELGWVNAGSVVKLSNLIYDGTTSKLSDGTNTIEPYNGVGYTPSFTNGKTYNVTGVFGNGYGTTDEYKRIYPRSATDIEEVVITDPYITIESNAFELTANEEEGYLEITYGNLPEEYSFDIQCYDAEGNELDECVDWLGLDIEAPEGEEGDFVYYFTSANQGPARTAYFKVYASWLVEVDGDVEIESVYSNLVTVTQAEFVPDYVVLPFNWEGGTKDELNAVNGLTGYGLGNDYAASNAPYRIRFDGNGDYILVKTDSQPGEVTIGIKNYGSSTGTVIAVQESSDGIEFTEVQELTITCAQNKTQILETTNEFASSTRYVRLYEKQFSANFGVGPITIRGIETYTKDIVGNTWYFISSPTGTAPTNVDALSDLFYYDEQDHYWRNKKIAANADGFDFGYGKGYLCANGDNENTPQTVTLSFTGTLLTGNTYSVLVTCHTTTTEGQPNGIDAKLAGWNLVGNPFNSNATLSVDCYILNGSSINTQAQAAGYVIAPFAGVMVKASEANQNVIFTKANQNQASQLNQLEMTVAQQVVSRGTATSMVHDNAIINFNEGSQLEKFIFNPDAAKLYIPQDNKEFAVVSSEANGEMPVCFKAIKDGEYTITVSPEGVELNYLHLIDNMTGMDVDLLQTPSYTFEASTRDYENRFRLVFAGASTDSATDESFAYYDGSEWKVSNEGDATLQVVDVIGRIVKSETINGNFNLNLNQKAGVYMLRLVNGENVKVQKVVVR